MGSNTFLSLTYKICSLPCFTVEQYVYVTQTVLYPTHPSLSLHTPPYTYILFYVINTSQALYHMTQDCGEDYQQYWPNSKVKVLYWLWIFMDLRKRRLSRLEQMTLIIWLSGQLAFLMRIGVHLYQVTLTRSSCSAFRKFLFFYLTRFR